MRVGRRLLLFRRVAVLLSSWGFFFLHRFTLDKNTNNKKKYIVSARKYGLFFPVQTFSVRP